MIRNRENSAPTKKVKKEESVSFLKRKFVNMHICKSAFFKEDFLGFSFDVVFIFKKRLKEGREIKERSWK